MWEWPSLPVEILAPGDLFLLNMNQSVQLKSGYTKRSDRLWIQVGRSGLRYRPHRMFEIARCADLARNEHIEREIKGEAQLITHCHSTSGKGQNETPRVITIL